MRKPVLALSLVAFALAGCSSSPEAGTAQLNVRKTADGEAFVANFDRALFADSGNGQTDLILLSGATDTATAGGPNVRQVIHVKVLWTPTRTIRLDSPSAGNAMIDWHVVAGDNDRVVYNGSCWARVGVDGDEATVDLREANVTVRSVEGSVIDPLQRAKLDGKFVARRADATVQAYINDLDAGHKTQTASAATPTVTP